MQVKKGDSVKVHYVGTLNDGNEFDNSYKRGITLDFTVGEGKMIKGFDSAILDMEVGQKKTVTLKPEEAYGHRVDEAIRKFSKEVFPEGSQLEKGQRVQGQSETGQPVTALVLEVEENEITLDLNHPLAGEELKFDIELVEIS